MIQPTNVAAPVYIGVFPLRAAREIAKHTTVDMNLTPTGIWEVRYDTTGTFTSLGGSRKPEIYQVPTNHALDYLGRLNGNEKDEMRRRLHLNSGSDVGLVVADFLDNDHLRPLKTVADLYAALGISSETGGCTHKLPQGLLKVSLDVQRTISVKLRPHFILKV